MLFIIQKTRTSNYKLHCDNDIDIGEELFTRPCSDRTRVIAGKLKGNRYLDQILGGNSLL